MHKKYFVFGTFFLKWGRFLFQKGTVPISKKEEKNDKIIKKPRQKRMVTSASMSNTNNRSSMARAKNARLYVRNNSTCTNRRK